MTAKKSAAKKAGARKASAKKSVAKKAAGKKTSAQNATAKQAVAKKSSSKSGTTRNAAAKNATAKNGAAKKSAAKKPSAKGVIANTVGAKPASAPRAPTRKSAPRKVADAAPIKHDAGDHTLDRAPLGAHVSVAGGSWEAAARCKAISSTSSQIFTKQANRWAEREIEEHEVTKYRTHMSETTVRWTCAHDSYLINLASPDALLRARSIESFRYELRRCHTLGLDALVSHPGNFMDERDAGLARNADAITQALESEPGNTRLLLELTAGQGTVLGSTFREMAALLNALPPHVSSRVGVCLDTAHVWAAGYDLTNDFDGVFQEFDDTLGLARLECLHLNDSKAKLGSHLDRHELIAEGTIGASAFRRLMSDDRFAHVPKVIETPKGDDHAASDSRMLARLRSYAAGL